MTYAEKVHLHGVLACLFAVPFIRVSVCRVMSICDASVINHRDVFECAAVMAECPMPVYEEILRPHRRRRLEGKEADETVWRRMEIAVRKNLRACSYVYTPAMAKHMDTTTYHVVHVVCYLFMVAHTSPQYASSSTIEDVYSGGNLLEATSIAYAIAINTLHEVPISSFPHLVAMTLSACRRALPFSYYLLPQWHGVLSVPTENLTRYVSHALMLILTGCTSSEQNMRVQEELCDLVHMNRYLIMCSGTLCFRCMRHFRPPHSYLTTRSCALLPLRLLACTRCHALNLSRDSTEPFGDEPETAAAHNAGAAAEDVGVQQPALTAMLATTYLSNLFDTAPPLDGLESFFTDL